VSLSTRWFRLGAVLVLAACSAAPAPTATAPEVTATPVASAAATALVSDAPASPTSSAAASAARSPSPGHTIVTSKVIGSGAYPAFTVDAPAGWSMMAPGFVLKTAADPLGLSVWDVGRVPSDPCHWSSTLRESGRTTDDLIPILLAQKGRQATKPTQTTLDGRPATYIEWSVPADSIVTGDADFRGCDDPGNGHKDFVSWFGAGEGERYEQVPGQVDRLWIFALDRQRLVMDATYAPSATADDKAELDHVAKSTQFE
jgi:hypothetical protein